MWGSVKRMSEGQVTSQVQGHFDRNSKLVFVQCKVSVMGTLKRRIRWQHAVNHSSRYMFRKQVFFLRNMYLLE